MLGSEEREPVEKAMQERGDLYILLNPMQTLYKELKTLW